MQVCAVMNNFFPQDTRIVELISAIGLIISSIYIGLVYHDVPPIHVMVTSQTYAFWAILFFILGSLQIVSIALYPRLEILRIILAWGAGTLWIWISLSVGGHDANIREPGEILGFVVGVGNLYAFIVNALLLRHYE
jgi:hypothetical protein